MTLDIKFLPSVRKGADTVAVFIQDKGIPGAAAEKLDRASGGLIKHALKTSKKFTGKAGQVKAVTLPPKTGWNQALLIGMGDTGKLGAVEAEDTGGKIFAALEAMNAAHAVLMTDDLAGLKKIKPAEACAHIAYGMLLRAYKFEKYKTKKKDEASKTLVKIDVAGGKAAATKALFSELEGTAQGVYLARDLVNEPPNHLFPDTFAKIIARELRPLGVEVEILDEKRMAKLGMGAALAVGQGSRHPPRMVVMRWNGGKSKSAPLAFVGKGITFDTGGVSLKPGAGMEEMKMDMGGAAAVTGVMLALARRKSKAHVVGIAALAENMPSGNAYRPSDILKSYSGKTIEVLNTDAEGRLVLADALSYIQKTYKPRLIVDLATLTGAMMVALGHEYCGVFANDDELWSNLDKGGKATGEKLWRMPLDEAWKKDMEGTVADLQNLAKSGRNAGACTAAGFLEHFIENKTPWAHMDIAGTAWVKSDRPTVPRYGTGFGVRLLNSFVKENYE